MQRLEDQAIDEDTSLTFDINDSDNDGDDLTYSAVNGGATIEVNGSTLTLTPPANYNGSGEVIEYCKDGQLETTQTFTLTVNPVNDAPTIDDFAWQLDKRIQILY